MPVKRYAVAASAGRTRRLPRIAVLLGVAGAVAVVMLLAARAPERARPVAEPARSQPLTPRASRISAVATATRSLYALTIPALEDAERFERAVKRVSAPGREATVRSDFGSTDDRATTLLEGRWRVLRSTAVGYRVERYAPPAASVALWTVTLVGSRELSPRAHWRTLTVDLVWTRNGWKVAGGSGIGGPSPATPVELLAAEARTFAPLRHVP